YPAVFRQNGAVATFIRVATHRKRHHRCSPRYSSISGPAASHLRRSSAPPTRPPLKTAPTQVPISPEAPVSGPHHAYPSSPVLSLSTAHTLSLSTSNGKATSYR